LEDILLTGTPAFFTARYFVNKGEAIVASLVFKKVINI
jgi:hypothetical protein